VTRKVIKVGDPDCPICEETSAYDRNISENLGFELVYYDLGDLGDRLGPEGCKILLDLGQYCLNPDNTISLPIYMVYEGGSLLHYNSGFLCPEDFEDFCQELIYDL
jgi:hypothetical protein